MKKILHIFVLVLVVPQIVFAAWWNPLDWFNGWSFFHPQNPQTQVLEDRVKELEKKLASSTPAATTAAEQPTLSSPKAETPSPKVAPKPQAKVQVNTSVQDVPMAPPKSTVMCNGQSYTTCAVGEQFACLASAGHCMTSEQLRHVTTCDGKKYYTVCGQSDQQFACLPEHH